MNTGKLRTSVIWFVAVAMSSVGALFSGCQTPGESTARAKETLDRAAGDGLKKEVEKRAQENAERADVQRIFARWISVQGGEARLKKLTNAQCLVGLRENGRHSFFHTAEATDGRYRYDIVSAGVTFAGGFDGTQGWQDGGEWGGGIYPQTRGEPLWHLWVLRALDLEKIFPLRRRLPDELIDGRKCAVTEMADGAARRERWYFEAKSGHLVRVVRDAGRPGQQTTYDYSDYRPVSKIMLPHSLTVVTDRGAKSVYDFVRVELNRPLASVEFGPPSALKTRSEKIDEVLKKSLADGWASSSPKKTVRVYASVYSPTSGIETALTISRRLPDCVLVERKSAGLGTTVSGFNGTVGWENSEVLGYHVLKDAELNELISQSWLGSDPYLREHFPLRSWQGETTVDGKRMVKLGLRSFGDAAGWFYFSAEDGRLARVEIDENPVTRSPGLRVEYSDYRTVGGMLIPFRVSYKNAVSETIITYKSVEPDVDIPDSFFEPRTRVD